MEQNKTQHGGKRPGAGRTKKEQSESFTKLAVIAAFKALPVLVKIIEDPKAKNTDKINASKIILDRAFGSVANMQVEEVVKKVIEIGYGNKD